MRKRKIPKRRRPLLHRSLHFNRVESDRRIRGLTPEVCFAELWEKENQLDRGRNAGYGTLQDLMFGEWDRSRLCRLAGGHKSWPRFIIRRRDAVIAATVVQWLGTNCGLSFLGQALERAGYRILYPFQVKERNAAARVRQDLAEAHAKLEEELRRLRIVESTIVRHREELERILSSSARN